VLDVPDRDQHVVIYTADLGSSSEEALRLLSVVGTQRMNRQRLSAGRFPTADCTLRAREGEAVRLRT
jgi:hypothetical protein